MSYRALALMRALSRNAGFRRGFFPWRQPSPHIWVTRDAMMNEVTPMVSCWRSWDPFPEMDHMFSVIDREFSSEDNFEARKIGDRTIGNASDNKNFAYNFDLRGFDPKNIKVKSVGQNIVVEAETQTKEDKDGVKSFSHRQYHRSVLLPKNVNPEELKTTLTEGGVLSIRAPLLEVEDPEVIERELKIEKEETPAVKDATKKENT